MKVFLGADHRGYELKNTIREHLQHRGYDVADKGSLTKEDDDDYPKYAYTVATDVLGEDGSFGVLVCGSGQGMAMAANKDDANVLVLPSDFIDQETALAVTDDFLSEQFSGEERHKRRVDQIEQLYG
jgi:ribose 5-phosphate isomerase B